MERFKVSKVENIYYVTASTFTQFKNLRHFITTRINGDENELNLNVNFKEDFSVVVKNYRQLSRLLKFELSQLVIANQVHGDNVALVEENSLSSNFLEQRFKYTDALVTNKKNIILVTLYADCVPIMIYDPVNHAIGLAHSGWKGTLLEIGLKTVKKMEEFFGSTPKDLLVVLGPSIGPESFEVSDDVAEKFRKKFGKEVVKDRGQNFLVNLWKSIELSLLKAGVRNIEKMGIDTYSTTNLFFSYRKERTNKRFGVFLGLL